MAQVLAHLSLWGVGCVGAVGRQACSVPQCSAAGCRAPRVCGQGGQAAARSRQLACASSMAGASMVVYDRDAQALRGVADEHEAVAASGVSGIAQQAAVVLTALPDDAVLRKVADAALLSRGHRAGGQLKRLAPHCMRALRSHIDPQACTTQRHARLVVCLARVESQSA
uniref:Uncharacterized protein n=1 Tax=Alexandrium monilatum TaxID=311494 RepID=A0A7S4V3G8_9DINO